MVAKEDEGDGAEVKEQHSSESVGGGRDMSDFIHLYKHQNKFPHVMLRRRLTVHARSPLEFVRIGSARPTALVAMFHGLGGNENELRPTAERWLAALPSVGFVLLRSPYRDYHGRELKSGAWSGDWYPFPHLRSAFGADEDGYSRMVTQVVSESCEHVNGELDKHLASLCLGNDQLILAGFSQGAAISAYTGLRRRCLGVLPMGGPCPPRLALLPDNDVTAVCVVVGDADHCVQYEELKAGFAKYPVRCKASGVHVIPNQGHIVSEASEAIGLAFLRSCLASKPSYERRGERSSHHRS